MSQRPLGEQERLDLSGVQISAAGAALLLEESYGVSVMIEKRDDQGGDGYEARAVRDLIVCQSWTASGESPLQAIDALDEALRSDPTLSLSPDT